MSFSNDERNGTFLHGPITSISQKAIEKKSPECTLSTFMITTDHLF